MLASFCTISPPASSAICSSPSSCSIPIATEMPFLRSPECTRLTSKSAASICDALASLEVLTWVYLSLLLPTCLAQSYIYVIIKRFIFVVSGEWDIQQEAALEQQRRSMGKMPGRLRRTTVTKTIGHGGRRRAKAELWFTMETPGVDADDSFLPSMIISPKDLTSSPITPFSTTSNAPLLSQFVSPRLGKKTSKSSLPPLPNSAPASIKGKDVLGERSTKMDMDFSDPDPLRQSPRSAEWIKPAKPSQQEPLLRGKDKKRELDINMYSERSIREGPSSSTRI